MLEIISAESAARKYLEGILKQEIPAVNKAIESAISEGVDTGFKYKGEISSATISLLRKAGYSVDIADGDVYISWDFKFRDLEEDPEIEKIVNEMDIKF